MSSSTDAIETTTWEAAAWRTEEGVGAGWRSNLKPLPTDLSRFERARSSRWVCIKIEVPVFPARPVRPARCTYVSALLGISNWRTRSMSLMSIPRAATSVAMSTRKPPRLKFLRVVSRCAWDRSPCSTPVLRVRKAGPVARSSASRLVCVKMMALDSGLISSTVTTSSRRDARAARSNGTRIARWETVVAVRASPSELASSLRGSLQYCFTMDWIHAGVVAEKRQVCALSMST
mmetsp:Transcript_21779/g.49257  ORF Transcript_21779/g.49257 Transcript_21779/m.49257 type:complete len:233 (-) Transcript_21779:767-1465(-)